MRKLLRSNLRRLAKSKVFWGCSFTLLAYSELILISTYTDMVRYNESLPLDSVFFASFSILGVFYPSSSACLPAQNITTEQSAIKSLSAGHEIRFTCPVFLPAPLPPFLSVLPHCF